ncbi:MAG: ribonuclease H-like domain-containing protein [Candidatus Dormibacteraeota bacterium]|nr:ribonuclease H-like domain-containing protein [Candidatus Dormibacteraeota bacterium]
MQQAALRERLTRLGAPPRPRAHLERALPRGFEVVSTPYGDAAMRQDVIPLPALEPDPGSVAYIDTETTGLSGGTGTYVFAAAIARPIDCGLRIAQLFLPQPGMEPALLYALREEVEAADAVATFNGGSFDLPVLRTRWVMARMPGEFTEMPHVDLLTLVRALYRHRLERCNLRSVEERLLGYEREDPISSALVPDAYFEYLHRGSSPLLEAALEHNRLDVISLVYLHSRLLRRLRGGDAGMDAADWLALGRHRYRRGARADGWRALRNATSFAEGEAAATAGLLMARRLIRRGSMLAADSLLGWLEAKASDDVRVAVARARLFEWRRRDPQLALDVVEAAQERMPEHASALESRRVRLRRKVDNRLRDRRKGKIWGDQIEAAISDGSP